MSSPRNQHNASFPAVPSSLSAGGHGMTGDYAEQERTAPRPVAHSLDDLTPYLGLRARLSQVWLNRWTILILLVLARVLIAIGNLHDRIDAAEADALSACTTVESMGSAMASMPHYMSQGTNQLAARGVEKAVDGLQQMLMLTITGLEEIFVFWINMLYGTYECLITFAVGGSAHVAVKIAEDTTKFLNDTLGHIEDDLNKGVGDISDGLNKFIGTIGGISSVLGGHADPPKIDLSSQIGELHNVQLPANINQGLDKLNSSIPSFDQVHNFTDTVLRLPFEEVKKLITASLGPFQFNESVFPVPQKEQLTFCSDDNGIANFFDSLYGVAETARKVFIAVLLIAALLACVPMALLELRRWRSLRSRAALVVTSARDPLDVVYIAARPYTAQAGLKLARNFSAPKRQILIRWFVAYITSLPALFVLAVAIAGYFSCLCQYILLQAIKKEVPALAEQVGAFADKVVTKLDNASAAWANGTNAEILSVNNKINSDVFGWVNTSTSAVNDTLNTFINSTTDVLHKAFQGTVLEDPVQQIFNCLVGLKVAKIEQGLTWVHDHAHIDFPLFPNDTFSQGASKALASNDQASGTNADGDSFLADPGSGASDKISAAVVSLVDKLKGGIRTEALIATGVLLCYLAVVLLGALWVLYRLCRRDKGRAEGGVSYAGDLGGHGSSNNAHDMAPVNPADSVFQRHRTPTRREAYEGGGDRGLAPQYTGRTASSSELYPSRGASEEVPRYEESVGYAGQRNPAHRGGAGAIKSEYGVVEDEKR